MRICGGNTGKGGMDEGVAGDEETGQSRSGWFPTVAHFLVNHVTHWAIAKRKRAMDDGSAEFQKVYREPVHGYLGSDSNRLQKASGVKPASFSWVTLVQGLPGTPSATFRHSSAIWRRELSRGHFAPIAWHSW